jgi:SAM-dependent methyltransferase
MPMPAGQRYEDENYHARLKAEKGIYEDCLKVHDLPPIFHYWSNKYIRPKLEAFGFSTPNDMFKKYLAAQCERRPHEALRFASIGAGNCDLEINLALHLRSRGRSNFVIDCLELNPTMLERGCAAAAHEGVAEQIHAVEADFNQWSPDCEYDAVLANQALHHVLNLEGLFRQIKSCLKPHGSFIISDMIGRNGHLRWPEALEIVHEYWRKLPPSYRFNPLLNRYEELYENWDCSGESFEGIRSQDILPLLVADFHFQLFIGFANVIDPFTDRVFGHNFDAKAAWDRAFIDQVHERDEQEMIAGHIKPTHMVAVVGTDPGIPTLFHEPFGPEFCIRPTEMPAGKTKQASIAQPEQGAYEWHSWPHSAQDELEIACRRLWDAEIRVNERTEIAKALNKELEERTAWAQRLDKEVEERTAWALRLDKELAERTAWAKRLNSELEQLAWARRLLRIGRKIFHGVGGIKHRLSSREPEK